MLFKIFIILFLAAAAFTIGRAFVTGSVRLRGETKPLRRQEDPRRFKEVMGIISVAFILLVAILVWIFVVPMLVHSR